MLIEQIIEFELKGSGPFACTSTPTTAYFYDKKKFSSELLFSAKILRAAMYLTSPY